MNHPTLGELRPQSVLSRLAARVHSAQALLELAAESPKFASAERLEVVIDTLCDAAVDLGGIVEGLREGAR
ncbi:MULTISPECIES: hypothetical protein [unclassified Methylococcus]|jgi:hypothetical protein|uniref:hypothetical protein n=1 Tax=unclassified Methylococcus TaxID=2618889 RepID=UPI003D7E3B93